jgi:hypothetical protein
MEVRSRGAFASEFCFTTDEERKSGPDPVRWLPAVVPAPSRSRPAYKKSGRRNADRRVILPSASYGCGRAPGLLCRSACGEGRSGALACRRSTAALAAANQRRRSAPARASWDLVGRTVPMVRKTVRSSTGVTRSFLSQSSELLADRSSCRPGVKPEPPEGKTDEVSPAGTALAPAAGVTRRPSYG